MAQVSERSSKETGPVTVSDLMNRQNCASFPEPEALPPHSPHRFRSYLEISLLGQYQSSPHPRAANQFCDSLWRLLFDPQGGSLDEWRGFPSNFPSKLDPVMCPRSLVQDL